MTQQAELHHSASWPDLAVAPIGSLMSTQVLTVYEGWSIKRLAGFFVKHNLSGAPVVAADDELVGVVTQSDVVEFESRGLSDKEIEKLVVNYCGPYGGAFSAQDLARFKEKATEYCTINEIMTPHVYAVDVNTPVASACRLIAEKNIHRLFVTQEDRLVGVVTAMDVLRHLV